MASIRQNPTPASGPTGGLDHPLPDWRNLGVMLRAVLGVNLLAALAVLAGSEGASLGEHLLAAMAWVEPLLLAVLGLLGGLRDLLRRLPPRQAQGAVLGLAGALAMGQYYLWTPFFRDTVSLGDALRAAVLAMAAAAALLAYFAAWRRAHSPALTEARLAALNARIRPHFLFNSLNAVLSLIRAQPRQAEAALESLSDLFRAALRDPRDHLPLAEEIALGEQYLALEKLRLGERLQVVWRGTRDLPDLRIPPLMLQPLLENAVYHGIEPSPAGGTVTVDIQRRSKALVIEVSNPQSPQVAPTPGRQMAVANIRERLALYYDLEARLDIEQGDGQYRVRITLPCRFG